MDKPPKNDVLVVDDRPGNIKVLGDILSQRGYRVRTALNGKAALAEVQTAAPDLILMDVLMPGMDGYQLCQILKSEEATADIPIIFLSALSESQDKLKAFVAGGVDYVTKPFEAEEVLARVKTHLALRAAQEELAEKNVSLEQELLERARAEERLLESEARYHSRFQQSPAALWEEDFSAVKAHLDQLREEGVQDFRAYFADHPGAVADCARLVRILEVNQTGLTMFAANSLDDLRDGLITIFDQQSLTSFEQQLISLLKGETRFEQESEWHSLTGEKVFGLLNVAVDPGHEQSWGRVLVSIADITQRKRAEQERDRMQARLLQAQKMQVVGQLAGGIAHDFNNLLTAINGFAELMQYQLPAGDPMQEPVSRILRSGQRAADLVRQLLAYSRRQMIWPKPAQLNQMVSEAKEALGRILGRDVELVTRLSPHLWPVMVDANHLERALTDLVINARDAMPAGGRLTLETRNVSLDDDFTIKHPEARVGDYVLLSVSDTGVGIEEEARQHIFEPFFVSSKAVADGIGLRMASIYGFIKQSEGYIWVESQPGQGSTFSIYLPRLEE